MIESAGLSDVGRKRELNEDYFLISRQHGLYLLADGMGGHAAGEVASELAVRTIEDFVVLAEDPREMTWPFGYSVQVPFEHNVLRTALLLANLRVTQTAQQKEQFAGMGATVVAVWVRWDTAFFSHVGDSRLYLFREGNLHQLTEDHTLVQEHVTRGLITPEEARQHRLRHVVTRAIGGGGRLDADVRDLQMLPGDTLLLCSDGLTEEVQDSVILEVLSGGLDVKQACQRLVDQANDSGGRDNVTVVLLQFGPA